MQKKIRVVIPAGGRSSRSGLNYPKSLHKIGGVPIIIRLCRLLYIYDRLPVIIINPSAKDQFQQVLDEYSVKAQFVFQLEPKGMGDAILKAEDYIENDADVLLVWSDIPLLSPHTVKQMADCHRVFNNDFTLVTALCDDCYTIIERDIAGKLQKLIETRAAGIPPGKNGERDIGLFIFKKEIVFSLLKKSLEDDTKAPDNKEKGFLHIIELLAIAKRKIEGYPIALPADVLSFNSPEDLEQINKSLGL